MRLDGGTSRDKPAAETVKPIDATAGQRGAGGYLGLAIAVVRRFPTTILLLGAFFAVSLLLTRVSSASYHSVLDSVGWDQTTLRAMHYWRQLPGTLVEAQQGVNWPGAGLLVLLVGSLEYEAGSLPAILTFFLSDWLSAPLATASIWFLSQLHYAAAVRLLNVPSSGASGAYVGCGAAAIMMLPRRWQAPALLVYAAAIGVSFFLQPLDASLAHVFGPAVGLVLGTFWRRYVTRHNAMRP